MKIIVIALSLLTSLAATASAQRGLAAEGYYGTSSDPDPNVRFELRRDAPWVQGG